jgi:hypothetical protein
MESPALITLVVAIVSSGLLTTVATQFWNRKRSRADTAAVLNETALDLVAPLRSEIKELRGEVRIYRQRVGMLERREREFMQALGKHAAWDIMAQAALMGAQIELHDEMPPIYPEFHSRGGERTRSEDFDLASGRHVEDDIP